MGLTFNIKMKALCLILLFHVSVQLQCDRREITAHIGSEFILFCTYDANRFLYNKKYWCRGDSGNTCEIIVDSERVQKTGRRSDIVDAGRGGLSVTVTHLQFDDTGVYWVGIDKIYADIMTSVKVVITQVPVSKPGLWAVNSLVDRPTCWGQPVTVRCGCSKGTGIRYAWYHKNLLLHQSSDLYLHCDMLEEDSDYYCIASNDINSERSAVLSVQVLMSADSSCIYVVNMLGQPIYDCADRMSTTTATTPALTTCQATMKIHSDTRNQSVQTNQTDTDFFFRTYTGVPLWYALLRWGSYVSLLTFLCIFLKCTKTRNKKRARKKRKVRCSQMHHLAL